jgi:chemotaxis protein CheD
MKRVQIDKRRNGDLIPSVTIHVGDIHVSDTPVKIKTILGSCIAACMYDPSTRIGGMNHFLLPGELDSLDLSTRYGVNAMEMLINEMMKIGANRLKLQAKVFGGADIFRTNHTLMMVGKKNIKFIRGFLETERIPVLSERLGGNEGLIVHYIAQTFEVFIKPVSTDRYKQQEEEEINFYKKIANELVERNSENITLF